MNRQLFGPGLGFWFAALLLGCATPSPDEGEHVATISREEWVQLGGSLNLIPTERVYSLALGGAPLLAPVVAYSAADPTTFAERTPLQRFREGGWEVLGDSLPESGPALGSDSQRRNFICTGKGPFVRRWNGAFVPVGGDIGQETGFAGSRYSVSSCGGIVLDRKDAPIVAWSADVGAKANVVFAARFDAEQKKWQGLGSGNIGERATSAGLAIDDQDRVYVVTYSPGGSYGGGATTRVFRLNGNNWDLLGAALPDTSNPVIATQGSNVHLALRDNTSGEVRVLRLHGTDWQTLPSPGRGDLPALDFTMSGNPVVAFAEGDAQIVLRVRYLVDEQWVSVGDSVSDDPTRPIELLDLNHEAGGRPIVTWSQLGCEGIHTNIFLKRYTVPLP